MNKLIVSVLFLICGFSCTKHDEIKNFFDSENKTDQNSKENVIEGTINGGGGKGVLCKNPDGTSKLELLDLYEAKVMYDLKMDHTTDSSEVAMDLFVDLWAKHNFSPWSESLEQNKKQLKLSLVELLTKKTKFIAADKKLKLINDSFEPLVAENCEMVQIAVYYDESIILIDSNLWKQMDWVSRIALLAHEVIYADERMNGANNSISTRKFVGQLFSTNGARPKYDGIPNDPFAYFSCMVMNTENKFVGYFWAVETKEMQPGSSQLKDGVSFVFSWLNGSDSVFRTYAFFSGFNLNILFDKVDSKVIGSPLYVDSYLPTKTLHFDFNGVKKGIKLVIEDKKTDTYSEEFNVACGRPQRLDK